VACVQLYTSTVCTISSILVTEVIGSPFHTHIFTVGHTKIIGKHLNNTFTTLGILVRNTQSQNFNIEIPILKNQENFFFVVTVLKMFIDKWYLVSGNESFTFSYPSCKYMTHNLIFIASLLLISTYFLYLGNISILQSPGYLLLSITCTCIDAA